MSGIAKSAGESPRVEEETLNHASIKTVVSDIVGWLKIGGHTNQGRIISKLQLGMDDVGIVGL